MKRVVRAIGIVLLWALGLLVVFVMAALVWLNTGWGKRYSSARVGSVVPGLSVNHLRGFVPFDMTLNGVAYDAPSAPYRLTVDVVGIDMSIRRSLAKRRLVISGVRCISPHATLRPAPSPSPPKHTPQGPPHLPISVTVERFTIENGAVTQQGKQESVSPIEVTGAASAGSDGVVFRLASLVATVSAAPSQGAVGSESAQATRLAAHGEAAISWPSTPSHADTPTDEQRIAAGWAETTVHARLGAAITRTASRGPIEVELNANGPLRRLSASADIAPPQGGTARLWSELDVTGIGPTHPYAMTLDLRSFDPSRMEARLPAGTLSLQASASGHGRPLSIGSDLRARVTVSPSRVAKTRIERLSLEVDQRDERWSIVTGDAQIAGLQLSLAGGGRDRTFDVQARAATATDDLDGVFGDMHVSGAISAVIRGRYPSEVRASVNGKIDELDVARLRARNIGLAASLQARERSSPTGAVRLSVATVEQRREQARESGAARSRGLHNVSLHASVDGRRASLAAIAYPFVARSDAPSVLLPPVRLHADQLGGREGFALASTHPISAEIDWRHVPLRVASEALGRDDSVSGLLDVHLVASGSLAEPSVSLATSIEQPRTAKVALPNMLTTAWVKLHRREARGELKIQVGSQPVVDVKARLAAGTNDLRSAAALRNAPLRIEANIPDYALGQLNQPGTGPRFGGIIDGSLRVEGTAKAPRAKGSLHIVEGSVDAMRFGSMDLDVEGGKDGARLSATVDQNSVDNLQAELSYQAGRALNLNLLAHDFDLSALQRIAPPLRALAPSLDGRLTVEGHFGPVPSAAARSKRSLVVDVDLSDAQMGLVLRPSSHEDSDKSQPKTDEAGQSQRSFQQAFPLEIHQLQVRNSRLFIVGQEESANESAVPVLNVSDIELSLENLANRPELLGKEPSVLAARARVQKQGELTVFATLDPTAQRPTLAGQAELRNLSLANLENLLREQAGIEATRGTFDCFVRFIVENGHISGGIKPELKNADIKPADQSLWSKSKALVAKFFLRIFRNETAGQKKVATVIPIEGRLSNPDVQLVPAVLGIVRNAFVVGLAGGFNRLPPPKAGQPENVIEQTGKALQPQTNAPEAQPSRPAQH